MVGKCSLIRGMKASSPHIDILYQPIFFDLLKKSFIALVTRGEKAEMSNFSAVLKCLTSALISFAQMIGEYPSIPGMKARSTSFHLVHQRTFGDHLVKSGQHL